MVQDAEHNNGQDAEHNNGQEVEDNNGRDAEDNNGQDAEDYDEYDAKSNDRARGTNYETSKFHYSKHSSSAIRFSAYDNAFVFGYLAIQQEILQCYKTIFFISTE